MAQETPPRNPNTLEYIPLSEKIHVISLKEISRFSFQQISSMLKQK
jgi:hypothetical protein